MNCNHHRRVGPYELISPIGHGAFSTAFQGVNMKTNEIVAMKFVNRKILQNHGNLQMLERELRIIERISHKNIVTFHNVYYLKNYIVIVMECLGNGTMETYKNSLIFSIDDSVYIKWAKDILEGLEYLHKKGIAHHDIKPDNIGFDDMMNAKIMDLGLCEEFTNFCYSKSGTAYFTAPEVFLYHKYDGVKSDVWSFGVTLHYLVTGDLPFKDISLLGRPLSLEKVAENYENKCNNSLRIIIDMALITHPNKRPTTTEILKHKVFAQADKGDNFHIKFNECKLSPEKKRNRKTYKNFIITPVISNGKRLRRTAASIVNKFISRKG